MGFPSKIIFWWECEISTFHADSSFLRDPLGFDGMLLVLLVTLSGVVIVPTSYMIMCCSLRDAKFRSIFSRIWPKASLTVLDRSSSFFMGVPYWLICVFLLDTHNDSVCSNFYSGYRKSFTRPYSRHQMFLEKVDSKGTSVRTACSSRNELSVGLR